MTDQKKVVPFVIDDTPTVEWPVTVEIPADGGVFKKMQFTGVFNVLSEEEHDALLERHPILKEDVPLKEKLAANIPFFTALMADWKGVTGSNGEPLPFSCLQKQVTGRHGVFVSAGIWRAIREIRVGAPPHTPAAIEGNSLPSPGTGSD